MIIITLGTENTLILTLTEKVTIADPVYFLFECICDQTNQAYHFIAADISEYSYRYNKFNVMEKTAPDLLHGEINLPVPGDYHYTVYQQNSSTNLDPTLVSGILETGKLLVMQTSSDPHLRYEPAVNPNIVFQG